MTVRFTDAPVLTMFNGVAFDEDGCGPYLQITGCPNCGKGKGEWWNPLSYSGAKNAGRDPDGPCSRACRHQLEWAAALAECAE